MKDDGEGGGEDGDYPISNCIKSYIYETGSTH